MIAAVLAGLTIAFLAGFAANEARHRINQLWPDDRPEPPPMVRLPHRVTRPPASNVRLCALVEKEPA